jgi:predicted AlkP superfamily phosphohydrolase/phosphomutase
MTAPTKILFLEIDAGDKVLIQTWARDGTLPTFGRLLRDGLVGDTISVRGLFVGSTWPSLYTGCNPARHGIYSLLQLDPGTYEHKLCPTGEHIKREPFWNYLSRAGRQVAVLDVPLSGISPGLKGIQTVEWGAHDANYGFRAWPPALKDEIEERFGTHPLQGSCNAIGRTAEDFGAFRNTLVEGVARKGALTRHFLGQGGWDFFGQVFTESHCVGHQCWHLHDLGHPGHDTGLAAAVGDPVRDVYVAIDKALGEIIADAGEDVLIVVLAGHRMAHKFGATFLLPDILMRLGLAVSAVPAVDRSQPQGAMARLDAGMTRAWQLIPAPVQRQLGGVRRTLRSLFDERAEAPGRSTPPLPLPLRKLNPQLSQCFLVDNGHAVAGVRLNLKGREPNGLIEPGPEAIEFGRRLAEDLKAIVNADTGRPIVREVVRTADIFEGEHLDILPDILVEWDDATPLGSANAGNPGGSVLRVTSPKIGTVEGTNLYCRTGDHRPEGMFMALGPRIQPGRLGRTVSLMDLAPTFTNALGVEMPDTDGQPIPELVAALRQSTEVGRKAV